MHLCTDCGNLGVEIRKVKLRRGWVNRKIQIVNIIPLFPQSKVNICTIDKEVDYDEVRWYSFDYF